MDALRAMASFGRSELLAHPVCTTLLERKWRKFGMWCSGLVMICNIIFVSLLSYVVVSAVTTELRPHLLRTSYCNVHRHAPGQLNSSAFDLMRQTSDPLLSNLTSARDFCNDRFYQRDPQLSFQDTPSLLVLSIALFVIFFKELAELRSEGLKYFAEWMNYMELMLFVSCGGFVVCFYQDDMSGKVGPLTYQFAAVALFLAWFNLLRFCRPFGTFGIYSFMFFCILKTLIKVSFFFFLLTCAFTGAFFTLFHMLKFPDRTDFYAHYPDLDVMSLRTPHYQTYTSGLRVGAMTIGDLEAIGNFINPLLDGMLEYPVVSFIFYVMFMMLMPILLNNLLTGLAIGDMAQIISNAASLRLEMQVYLHESLEKLFPTSLARRFQKETQMHRIYPAKSLGILECIAQWLQSGGVRDTVGIADHLHGGDQTADENEDLAMEFGRLERRVKHMDAALSEQRVLLQQMLHQLEKLTHGDNDPATAYATSIVDKARKRGERTEEDRRQAAKLHITKRSVEPQFSLRSLSPPPKTPLRKAFSFKP